MKRTKTLDAGERLEQVEVWAERGARCELRALIDRVAQTVPAALVGFRADVETAIRQVDPGLLKAPTREQMARAHRVLSGGANELAAAMRRVNDRKAAGVADGTPWNEPKARGRMTEAGRERIRQQMRKRWKAAKKAGKNHL